jgi:hypothetical protein
VKFEIWNWRKKKQKQNKKIGFFLKEIFTISFPQKEYNFHQGIKKGHMRMAFIHKEIKRQIIITPP